MRQIILRKYSQTGTQGIEYCSYKGLGTQLLPLPCDFSLKKQREIRRQIVRVTKRIEKGEKSRKRGRMVGRIDAQVRKDLKGVGEKLFRAS